MLNTLRSRRGMVVSPHHLASQAGLAILREGGNAVEATVAVAATLGVVYPHMIGMGGDAFWLIGDGGDAPLAIDACGAAGAGVDGALYRGLTRIPERGPLAANTVAGAVSGWMAALEISSRWGGRMPLERLLADAIYHAEAGVPVADHLGTMTADIRQQVEGQPGFAAVYLPGGAWARPGDLIRQPALAETLRRLAKNGLDDFYRGELARSMAADLARVGSPLTEGDLARHRALPRDALMLRTSRARLFNFPPPTQGLASLLLLGLFDRLAVREAEGFAHVHALVEATKRAYAIRNEHVADPAYMKRRPEEFLAGAALERLAGMIDRNRAGAWRSAPDAGDTAWMGVIDGAGRAVSHIQSVFYPWGSGVVLDETGVLWQNRGSSFDLEAGSVNPVTPGRKPFHTLNPAMARLDDGRLVVYGTMGAHGQPQFQAAVMTRYAWFGQPPQQAVSAPRWLLDANTEGGEAVLRIEERMDGATVEALRAAGHRIEILPPFAASVGHAGMVVRQPSGALEGAVDPRSDGVVAAF